MGKRKIAIEKIEDRVKRSVTFTKRRDGLFKKAETACQKFGGLQIGIVVFSPAGKPFTFSNSSSSVSVDEIIDTYISSSSTSSSAVVMGKRNRSDEDDDVQQVIETEKKKKQKTMNAPPPPPPCITTTVQEEEEEEVKLDQGFHWDSDQTHHHDDQEEELRNNEEFIIRDYGENEGILVTEEMINMESSQFLVEGDQSSRNWAPPPPPDVVDQLQEIINVEDDDDDDFEYANDHHHPHCDDETTTMGLLLLPPPPPHTTTSFCDSMSASDMNEVGEANEDDGYTLEEWENILNTSPTVGDDSTVVGHSTLWSSSSCLDQEIPAAWPTQDFLQLLCS